MVAGVILTGVGGGLQTRGRLASQQFDSASPAFFLFLSILGGMLNFIKQKKK